MDKSFDNNIDKNAVIIDKSAVIKEEKALLRKELRARERELGPEYKTAADAAISEKLYAFNAFKSARTILAYYGTEHEINTRPILEKILENGKRLFLPRCRRGGEMDICEVTALCELTDGLYGIPEPPESAACVSAGEIDLVIVPCISCSEDGARLGHGGGYYDRFLPQFKGNSVMLCRKALLSEYIPVTELDVSIPTIITD